LPRLARIISGGPPLRLNRPLLLVAIVLFGLGVLLGLPYAVWIALLLYVALLYTDGALIAWRRSGTERFVGACSLLGWAAIAAGLVLWFPESKISVSVVGVVLVVAASVVKAVWEARSGRSGRIE